MRCRLCPCTVLLEKDSLQTRLTVDGVPYRESASIFRTVTRMAGSGSLTGSMVLNLTAGTHVVQLQWMKTGSGVASWWSQPEFLDGFVTSRSLIVFQERYEMVYHQALTSSDPAVDPRLVWRDVNEASVQVCGPAVLWAACVRARAVGRSPALLPCHVPCMCLTCPPPHYPHPPL